MTWKLFMCLLVECNYPPDTRGLMSLDVVWFNNRQSTSGERKEGTVWTLRWLWWSTHHHDWWEKSLFFFLFLPHNCSDIWIEVVCSALHDHPCILWPSSVVLAATATVITIVSSVLVNVHSGASKCAVFTCIKVTEWSNHCMRQLLSFFFVTFCRSCRVRWWYFQERERERGRECWEVETVHWE